MLQPVIKDTEGRSGSDVGNTIGDTFCYLCYLYRMIEVTGKGASLLACTSVTCVTSVSTDVAVTSSELWPSFPALISLAANFACFRPYDAHDGLPNCFQTQQSCHIVEVCRPIRSAGTNVGSCRSPSHGARCFGCLGQSGITWCTAVIIGAQDQGQVGKFLAQRSRYRFEVAGIEG